MKNRILFAVLALTTFAGNAPASSVCSSEAAAYAAAESLADSLCSYFNDPFMGSLWEPCGEALESLALAQMNYLRCLYRLDQNSPL